VPTMAAAWFAHEGMLAAQIFALAAVTDALDGYIARTWPQQQSTWGAFMDPVADKVLVCCALFLSTCAHSANPAICACAMVIVARELMVSALREFGARAGRVIPVDRFGKAKTALQCVALALLLCRYNEATDRCGTLALAGAALLSLVSGWRYARPFFASRR